MATSVDVSVLSKNFTEDAVALLNHEVEVQPLGSGQPPIPAFAAVGETNCPGLLQNIGLPQCMLLLNKIALYRKRAGDTFDPQSISLLEKWYKSQCNAQLLKAQCSILGLDNLGTKPALAARLLAAEARPMLPGFILAWLQAHAEMLAGTRQPGHVEFSTAELAAAVPYVDTSVPDPPLSEVEVMQAKIDALVAELAVARGGTSGPGVAGGPGREVRSPSQRPPSLPFSTLRLQRQPPSLSKLRLPTRKPRRSPL